jgi:hypothetical protein
MMTLIKSNTFKSSFGYIYFLIADAPNSGWTALSRCGETRRLMAGGKVE